MKVLVLDTIHGGREIGSAFAAAGHDADMVDVYRNSSTPDIATALSRSYDLTVAPVHLDPGHPLLRSRPGPVITHHAAVRVLLSDNLPHPMVEITGKRGKTTTAMALAAVMPGPGVLLSSRGILEYPGQRLLARASITPASVLLAAERALETGGWLVAEESLGVTGAGDLAILTSAESYPFAAGKKDALAQKLASLPADREVLLAPGIACDRKNAVHLEDVATCDGTECRIRVGDRSARFASDLLGIDAYRTPLMLAGTAALMLGFDPAGLAGFPAVEGRMSVWREGDILVLDNANSGTDAATTVTAARYAREQAGAGPLTLVIGTEPGDGRVCEGFPDDAIAAAIRAIRPARVVLVGPALANGSCEPGILDGTAVHRAKTLAQGMEAALGAAGSGSIVLAVKTWR